MKFKRLKKNGYTVEQATDWDLDTLSKHLHLPSVAVAAFGITKDMGETSNGRSKLNHAYVWQNDEGALAFQAFVGGAKHGVHMNTRDKNGYNYYLPKKVAREMLIQFLCYAEMTEGGLEYNNPNAAC